MYYRSKKFNLVRILIIIMIGAVSIVFTDLFILNGARIMWWNNNNEEVDYKIEIDIASLRNQNNYYLQHGIDLPDVVTANNALPGDFLKTNEEENIDKNEIEFSVLSPLDRVIANIEPATGMEGDSATFFSSNYPKEIISKNSEISTDMKKTNLDVKYYNKEKNLNKNIISNSSDSSKTLKLKTKLGKRQFLYDPPQVKGKIAIIIDDMGVNLTSKLVEIMPAPLTLSYLPYAKNLQARVEKARKKGHEIMLHLPMEPISEYKDAGSHVLKVDSSKAELIKEIEWNLSRFNGYVGVNNHMGSRMTQDERAMNIVMAYLKKRNLFFIDSRTIGNSVAIRLAKEHGINYAKRDVFIDHEVTEDFVRKSLKKLEKKALRDGYAIAIGHPHKVSIKVLKEWIPTLKDKGLEIVPVSSLLYKVQENKNVIYNNASN